MKINSTQSLKIPFTKKLWGPRPVDPSVAALDELAVAIFAKKSREQASNAQPETGARAVAQQAIQPGLDRDTIYRCRNCGKRMKLGDAANYYGMPACPECVHGCASFEIVPESPGSGRAENP
jgi:DNA-directed RNA polymerase subunit RPC12/RpoP